MSNNKNILTSEGFKKCEDELHDLKVNRRQEVAQKIKEAREQGDLSENAEYDAAKDEQRDIEARIEELEKILKDVEVVDLETVDCDTVSIGNKITVMDLNTGNELVYYMVGSIEADIFARKISNLSPVGAKFLGSKVGDEVSLERPTGTVAYKILEIGRFY